MGFNRGVHTAGNNERIFRSQLVGLLVGSLGLLEMAARGIQVTERQVRNVEIGIDLGETLKVLLGI